ncbi:hypothetical protein LguiB_001855 [Lonicera macranthoides]
MRSIEYALEFSLLSILIKEKETRTFLLTYSHFAGVYVYTYTETEKEIREEENKSRSFGAYIVRKKKMASSNSSSPCAACKFLRRKCQAECVFAPYFPPEQPQKFANVHKVFGASNVTKLLNELHPHQREDAVNSLAYEADMRLRDPVYGCVGVISLLQHQLRQLQIDLTSAKSELSKYQNHRLLAVAAAAHHHQFFPRDQQHHQHQHQMITSATATTASANHNAATYDASSLLAMNINGQLSYQYQPRGTAAGGAPIHPSS